MPRVPLPKDTFFAKMDALGLALTYDDVRLKTGHAEKMPDEVSVTSRFSRNVPLPMPITSAAMDTVTEHAMATALAKAGGLGVIHRNLSPEAQAREIACVKSYPLLTDPITIPEDQTIAQILKLRNERKYTFHTFLVVDATERLTGVLSRNDFDFCADASQLAKAVMSTHPITAPPGTTAEEAYRRMVQEKKKTLPLVDTSGRIVGLYLFNDVEAAVNTNRIMCNVDANGQLRVGAAVGVHDYERLEQLLAKGLDVAVVDTAHADTKSVLETLRQMKQRYPTLDVVVGNISQPDSARRLLDAGADGIKVGQGPGSICTTRINAGVGCPQVTAVYNCAKIADEYGIPVCADGGLRNPGDVVIALGAGASSVMMGNILAGTDETPGDIIRFEGRQYKVYRGMGSAAAMQDNQGSRERYRAGKSRLVPEGVEGRIPYKGPVAAVLEKYMGYLRVGMGYVGAASVEELQRKGDFDRITIAGEKESYPHDIDIIREE